MLFSRLLDNNNPLRHVCARQENKCTEEADNQKKEKQVALIWVEEEAKLR